MGEIEIVEANGEHALRVAAAFLGRAITELFADHGDIEHRAAHALMYIDAACSHITSASAPEVL